MPSDRIRWVRLGLHNGGRALRLGRLGGGTLWLEQARGPSAVARVGRGPSAAARVGYGAERWQISRKKVKKIVSSGRILISDGIIENFFTEARDRIVLLNHFFSRMPWSFPLVGCKVGPLPCLPNWYIGSLGDFPVSAHSACWAGGQIIGPTLFGPTLQQTYLSTDRMVFGPIHVF